MQRAHAEEEGAAKQTIRIFNTCARKWLLFLVLVFNLARARLEAARAPTKMQRRQVLLFRAPKSLQDPYDQVSLSPGVLCI